MDTSRSLIRCVICSDGHGRLPAERNDLDSLPEGSVISWTMSSTVVQERFNYHTWRMHLLSCNGMRGTISIILRALDARERNAGRLSSVLPQLFVYSCMCGVHVQLLSVIHSLLYRRDHRPQHAWSLNELTNKRAASSSATNQTIR